MKGDSLAARKFAYLFLALCLGAALTFAGFRIYDIYGPNKIVLEGVPYGVPANTVVLIGDTPDILAETQKLPIQIQTELRRALELLRAGSYAASYDIFEGVLAVYPDLLPALFGQAHTIFAMDSLTQDKRLRLEMILKNIQSKYPESGISAYLESRSAYVEKNENASLELATIAVTRAPALYAARLWYGKLLMSNGREIQAEIEFKTALSLTNGSVALAYEYLAELYHNKGNLDSCSAIVEYALSRFPANVKLLLLQGYLAEYQGHFDAAEKLYRRILAFNPDYALASVALATLGEKAAPGVGKGSVLSPIERVQTACDILEPLVERYSENLPLREALGRAYMKGRMFDKARAQFKEIQNADPEYPDIQQRVQESNVTRPAPISKNDGLTANLNRAIDSLRENNLPSSTHDFTTMLGHYVVRYGATPREFFKKYSISNFRPVANNVWQESFYIAPYMHTYTVIFDSLNHFREVHVVVVDSSSSSNYLGIAPEIYTRLLKQNSRISGIGNSTGETDCGDGLVLDAAVWETQDNFEILARVVGKPAEVRMVRFDKSAIAPGLKLCDYSKYLNQY